MNSINIRALDGGFTVGYQEKNPKYVEATGDAKPAIYQPKTHYKTKVFTDKNAIVEFVKQHLDVLQPAEDGFGGDIY